MSVNIRSFDVTIGMVGLSPHRADTMCRERAICLQLPNHETLIIHGDKPGANPLPISCIKAQKCLHHTNYVFLAQVVGKTKEEVSKQGIPVAYDFFFFQMCFPRNFREYPRETGRISNRPHTGNHINCQFTL